MRYIFNINITIICHNQVITVSYTALLVCEVTTKAQLSKLASNQQSDMTIKRYRAHTLYPAAPLVYRCADHTDWCYTSATRAHLSVNYLSDVCSNASQQSYPISGGGAGVLITQTGATLVLRELISLSIISQMFALMHLNRATLYPAEALVYWSHRLVLH